MKLSAFSVEEDRARVGADAFRPADLWRPLAAKRGDDLPEAAEPARQEKKPEAQEAKLTSEALANLESARKDLEMQMERLESRFRRECASSLAQIVSAAAPSICEAAAKDAIAAVFTEERKDVRADVVSFLISPDIYEAVEAERNRRFVDLPVTIDESLKPGSVRIRWSGGGLDCDVGRSLFAIVEFLSSSPQPEQEAFP